MFGVIPRVRFIEPQLPSLVEQPPEGKHWIHEIKQDRDPKTRASRALLAHNGNSGLSYAGAAFIALAGDERARFFSELDRLAVSWSEFKASRNDDVTWCQPKLTVKVKHLANGKMLRHATVRGLA